MRQLQMSGVQAKRQAILLDQVNKLIDATSRQTEVHQQGQRTQAKQVGGPGRWRRPACRRLIMLAATPAPSTQLP